MIIPLTLPPKSSPDGLAPTLPSALAWLGSSELFLLELQGELEVSGDKHGQLVGRLTIDDTNDGKVRTRVPEHLHFSQSIPEIRLSVPFSFVLLEGQADTANRPPPLGGQDRQFAQATGYIAAHVCAAATIKLI